MKTNKIEGQPEWFDLEKYENVKDFDTGQWAAELHRRSIAMKFDDEKEVKRYILSTPILCESQSRSWLVGILRANEKSNNSPVRELTFYDLFFMASDVIEQHPEMWSEWNNIEENNDSDIFWEFVDNSLNPYIDWNRIDRTTEVTVNISLEADDQQIINSITELLPQLRKSKAKQIDNRERVDTVLRKLYEKRILQQIDLRIFEKVSRKKITYRQIANWVFPDKTDTIDAETIRKQDSPYLKLALSKGFAYRLAYSAKD